jgi:hypothetical protein
MLLSTKTRIKEVIKEYVNGLNGRYRSHVSDEFLESILVHFISESWSDGGNSENRFYEAGSIVFEVALELDCKAGGNGHHVAQDFASFLMKQLYDEKSAKALENFNKQSL